MLPYIQSLNFILIESIQILKNKILAILIFLHKKNQIIWITKIKICQIPLILMVKQTILFFTFSIRKCRIFYKQNIFLFGCSNVYQILGM